VVENKHNKKDDLLEQDKMKLAQDVKSFLYALNYELEYVLI